VLLECPVLYIESCFIVDDVSVVVGGGVVGGVVVGGGVAMVVSALYPPPALVSGLVLVAVSIGVLGADAGGGRLRAVSEGETRPVSGGGVCPPLFSFW
jgi:hypothetical protein